jgi:hypothetical protein
MKGASTGFPVPRFTLLVLFTLRSEGSLEGSPEAIREGHAAPFPLDLSLVLPISAHSVSLRLAFFLRLSTVQPPRPPTFKRCSPRILSLTLLRRASSISPLPATLTKNQPGWGLPSFFKSVSHSNPSFTANSHRIKFFAYPLSLTPIESYSCKKQGEGSGPRASTLRLTSLHAGIPVYPEPWAEGQLQSLQEFTSQLVDTRGWGYFARSRPYFIASLRLCFRLLSHSNKSGCSRVIRSHIGWNWNQPASGLPTCECVSLAVS